MVVLFLVPFLKCLGGSQCIAVHFKSVVGAWRNK